jgi:hypothetical protein
MKHVGITLIVVLMFSLNTLATTIEDELKEFAESKHPNDPKLQEFVYRKQMSAHRNH